MNTNLTLAALSRFTTLSLMLGLLSLGSLGCGSASPPSLTITSINQNKAWTQDFTQAWMSRNSNGDVDVVLVDKATEDAMKGSAATCPVRQVMHIRVLWCATRDMKAVVSNASVKWYVIGQSQPHDILEYSGIAFVYLNEGDGSATLKVRNSVLNPTGNPGKLNDPVGPSRLEGEFTARSDSATVTKILQGLKTAEVAAAAENALPRVAKN